MKRIPERLRVLMSTDTVGGVWMYSLELIRALRPHGIHVILATMGKPLSPQQRHQAATLDNLILCESRFRLEWMSDPWRDVDGAGWWLLQLEHHYRPDLIHLNHFSHGHLGWKAPHLVVGHSCVLSWWRAVHGTAAPSEWDLYAQRVRRGLQHAEAVVAPSNAMINALQRHYGPLPGTVIHNGRAADDYPALRKRSYVLAVGRFWDAAKNTETLMQVAPGLDWPVYLAGEARNPDGGRAALRHVRTLGQLAAPESLRRWYGSASIYVLPARYEPFGLSVLEAALARCALVLGDIDSLRELWDGAACFVPPDDPAALQRAINRLIRLPQQRQALAERAAVRARCYGSERMAREYLALYDNLLAGRNVTARASSARAGTSG